MIKITNLTTGYRDRHGKTEISKGITAEFKGGELVTMLGPNGAGKSTLLKTLSGFLSPLGGEVEVLGKALNLYSRGELSKIVSVVLTERPSVVSMTVEEMVAMGRSPYTGFRGKLTEDDKNQIADALAKTGLEEMKTRLVDTLSDGELQKVMIAKALAQTTPIILLDEPSAFLDYPSKVELMIMLRSLAHETGKMILLSTHDLNIALQLSDKVILVDKKIGVSYDTPKSLSASGELERYFTGRSILLDKSTGLFQIKEC